MKTQDIWDNFSVELLGFIKSRINDHEIAEDLLQDVFIKIHVKLKSLNKDEKLTSWIYQITRNTIVDFYRKKKILSYQETIDIDLPESLPDSNRDFVKCLRPFINQLPNKYKDALYQITFNNLSQKEYAEQNNISYSTAKSRIQRGRQKLKDLFINCCSVQTDKYGNVISSKNKSCKC